MPSRKDNFSDKTVAVVYQGDAPFQTSKLPRKVHFPLVVILSLVTSALLHSLAAEYTAGELATVSRSLNEWWEVSALLGWRTLELALGWFGNYDSYDLVSLSVLSHGPPLYLLATFYNITPSTIIFSLFIDALSTYIPFRLLRPLSPAHASSISSKSVPIPNREIVTDLLIQILTAVLAAGIYSVCLYTSYASYLSVALVVYFNNLPSIEAAHNATPISLLPLSLVLGLAVRSFIFTPAMASSTSTGATKAPAFNPSAATLSETFKYNLWNYSSRTKIIIERTATLILVSGVNTFLYAFITLEGVEALGAAAYAGVWAVAALICGLTLGFVVAV